MSLSVSHTGYAFDSSPVRNKNPTGAIFELKIQRRTYTVVYGDGAEVVFFFLSVRA